MCHVSMKIIENTIFFLLFQMASKRKASLPQRADDTKRQSLSWNLFDDLSNCTSSIGNISPLFKFDSLEKSDIVTDNQAVDHDKGIRTSGNKSFRNKKIVIDENLKRLIDECDFFVTLHKDPPRGWHGMIGKFHLQLAEPSATFSVLLDHIIDGLPKFWLYVNRTTQKHLIYIQMGEVGKESENPLNAQDKVMYFSALSSLPVECMDGLQLKDFWLKYISSENGIEIEIYILQQGLTSIRFGCQAVTVKKCSGVIQRLMAFFYKIHFQGLFMSHNKINNEYHFQF